MRKVIRINLETGMFIEDVILQNKEDVPVDCIETPCPNGFYHPMWNGFIWVEGLTQEQIEQIVAKNPKHVQPLTVDQFIDVLVYNGFNKEYLWPL